VEYALAYFIADLILIYLGLQVGWLCSGLFLVIIMVLNVLNDYDEICDSEKSWGYALLEVNVSSCTICVKVLL